MLKIGLTGGIGSGKSVVADIFKVFGIPVFDADKEAKKIMESDEELKEALTASFGLPTYENGRLNRRYLAQQVFNDSYKLEKLNALVHPVIIAKAENWMSKQNTPYIIKEAALMFEAGSAENLDYVIGVSAPVHLRIQRVMHRDGLPRDEVKARMDRQIQDDIKMKLCDFVLVNDEQHLLIPQVTALHAKLLNLIN